MSTVKQHIVFFTPSFAPKKGGVEKHVERVARSLVRQQYDVTVIVPSPTPLSEEIIDGVRIIRVKKFLFFSNPFNFLPIRKYLRAADIFHAHDFFMGCAAWPWAKLFRKPLYVTFHGWEGRIPPRHYVKVIRQWLERHSQGAILVGTFMKKWYGHISQVIVYGGTNSTIHTQSNKKNDYFCFVGRIAEDTGIRLGLEVFREIIMNRPSARLTIAGDGPLRAELETMTSKAKLPVRWLGWIDHPEKIVADSKFCFTSGYLGILDALDNGAIPVTFADSALKKDYLLQTPFGKDLIVGSSATTVCDDILKAIDLPSLRDFDNKRYSWDSVADMYVRLWQNGKSLVLEQ